MRTLSLFRVICELYSLEILVLCLVLLRSDGMEKTVFGRMKNGSWIIKGTDLDFLWISGVNAVFMLNSGLNITILNFLIHSTCF